ncbi:transporter [Photobacterium kagoshimensis]|uniref:transporter n=1 Tax=Photobacterium kagoshimensis TaxID=2910242 RepID=UPI003D12DCC9
MNTFKYKSLVALLTLCSSAVFAEEPSADQTGDKEEKPKRVQTVADIFEQPGVLTPRGSFVLDTSFSYTQNSSNSVSVVGYTVLPSLIVGLIEASDVDRTTLTVGFTGRYGITNRFEVETRIPLVYRADSISKRKAQTGANNNELIDLDGSGLGDIEAAFKYQFNMNTAPYWIGSLRFKSTTGKSPYDVNIDPKTNEFESLPTGSGFASIEPGITMILPIDPAVIYASTSYIWNIEDDVDTDSGTQTIDLGDTISFSAGMGFAVNPKFSFSMGLSHKTILKSKINGATPDNAKLLQLDSLSFGANYAISRDTTINIGATAGLTADAPDFQLSLRIPITLK